MPRYYFDTEDGGRDIDNHGSELPNEQEAIYAATRYAGDLLSDQPSLLDADCQFTVTARGEQEKVVATLRVTLQHGE